MHRACAKAINIEIRAREFPKFAAAEDSAVSFPRRNRVSVDFALPGVYSEAPLSEERVAVMVNLQYFQTVRLANKSRGFTLKKHMCCFKYEYAYLCYHASRREKRITWLCCERKKKVGGIICVYVTRRVLSRHLY